MKQMKNMMMKKQKKNRFMNNKASSW